MTPPCTFPLPEPISSCRSRRTDPRPVPTDDGPDPIPGQVSPAGDRTPSTQAVDRDASLLLADVRSLIDGYEAQRAADPAEGKASVVRGWLHRILTDILGWPATARRPLAASLCATTALAYACPGDGQKILVHALSHGGASDLDPRTARSAGYRWLIESDVATLHIHDLESLHCLSMGSDRNVGLSALLSELRFGPGLAAGLAALSAVAAVRAEEPDLLGHLMDRHREDMARKLMDYAEGRGIAFPRNLANSLLADGHSFLDILVLWARDPGPDGCAPSDDGPASGATTDAASARVYGPNVSERDRDNCPAVAPPENDVPRQPDSTDLVYERILITRPSSRPMVTVRVRVFKAHGRQVWYELLAGSGIAVGTSGPEYGTVEAVRISVEERHLLLMQAGVRSVAPTGTDHTGKEERYCGVARYITHDSVIASSLGAIIKATIGYKNTVRSVFIDESTGRPVSQLAIEADAEAAEQALNTPISVSSSARV